MLEISYFALLVLGCLVPNKCFNELTYNKFRLISKVNIPSFRKCEQSDTLTHAHPVLRNFVFRFKNFSVNVCSCCSCKVAVVRALNHETESQYGIVIETS